MADLAASFLHGLEIARAANDAKERLNLERRRVQLESQQRAQALQQESTIRQQTNERQDAEQQARLQTEAAYHDAEIGLAQQRLSDEQAVNAQRVHAAALKMADQHGFASDLASGVPIEQALYRHPNANPSSAIAAHKSALNLAGDRVAIAQKNLDLRARQLDQQDRSLKDRENKPANPGHMTIPSDPKNPFGPALTVPVNSPLINKIMGTNAPAGTGTNFNPGGAAPPPAPAALPGGFTEGQTIRSKADGKLYTIKDGVPVPQDDAVPPQSSATDDDNPTPPLAQTDTGEEVPENDDD